MKKSLCMVLCIILVLFALPINGEAAVADVSWVKVKISTNNATSLTLTLRGEYFIQQSGAALSGGTLTVRSTSSGLEVTHSTAGLVFEGSAFSLMRASIARTAGYVKLNSYYYLGHFNFKRLSSGYIQAVNEVPLAHYLYGVVGSEMSDTFPIEALKAQAVAAKCYVLSKMNLSGDYYIGDTSSDQVYHGYDSSETNVIAAVDATIDKVLTVGGQLLCTYYAASNGGETTLPSYAWSSLDRSDAGYAVSIDQYDIANQYSKCEAVTIPIGTSGTISQNFYNLLIEKGAEALNASGDLLTIERISAVTASGPKYPGVERDLTKLTIVADFSCADGWGGSGQSTYYSDIAMTFDMKDLYSERVFTDGSLRTYWGEYSSSGNAYYLYHMRWGHGVGISQRGAQQRALSGHSYADILSFYYPGARLSTMNVQTPVDPVRPQTAQPSPSPSASVLPESTEITQYGQVTGSGVKFRTGPSTSYAIITSLAKYTEVDIYYKTGSWYCVRIDGRNGFVSGSYIKVTGNATPAPSTSPAATPSPTQGTATTSPTTNNDTLMLPPPSTDGTPVASGVTIAAATFYDDATGSVVLFNVPAGVNVDIFAQVVGRYHARYDGYAGYVSVSEVKLTAVVTANAGTSPSPSPTAGTGDYVAKSGMITRSGVNFRTGPSTDYGSIRKLSEDTGIVVTGETETWYAVTVGTTEGYVYKDYVKITGTAPVVDELDPEATGKGVTTGKVNFREGRGTSYNKLSTLSKGTELVLFDLEDGWYEVGLTDGSRGYVSAQYIQVTYARSQNDEATETPEQPEIILGTGVTTGTVNFRQGPSTSAKKLDQLKKGAALTVYSLSDGWYRVLYNGTEGYLYAKYVKITATLPATSTPTTPTPDSGTTITPASSAITLASGKTTGKLNLRNAPTTSGSSVITTFARDTELTILGKCGDWYYVLYDTVTGFVSGAYATVTSSGTAGIPDVRSDSVMKATTTSGEVNLRAGMGTNYEKLDTIPGKTAITVFFVEGTWCFVRVNGVYGFLHTDYVNL